MSSSVCQGRVGLCGQLWDACSLNSEKSKAFKFPHFPLVAQSHFIVRRAFLKSVDFFYLYHFISLCHVTFHFLAVSLKATDNWDDRHFFTEKKKIKKKIVWFCLFVFNKTSLLSKCFILLCIFQCNGRISEVTGEIRGKSKKASVGW